MDKKELTRIFEGEELILAIGLLEKYSLSKEYNIPMFSQSFLTPNIWMYFTERISKDISVELNGGFEDCERKMIAFNNLYEAPFPMKILEITNKSRFRSLEHKDYLGGILSLGIKRDKLGDLILDNDKCFVAVSEELTDFLIDNLEFIGKNPCDVKIVKSNEELPSVKFTESNINIASLRIDSVVASLANVSRSEAVKLINSGKILVNYSNNIDKSYEVKLNSTITIRGKGKFIISEITGKTKSDKLKIRVKKYT
ncbi:RNA-binding protein [Clostridium intestinale]|jgi:RNA-binding protein YlmH|uniref:RNA-binding protein n=1 Tax=Clostridium intestinale TaxID=36845 RepID=A0A7D6VY71_9CLOT|nr:YlmH/Sll1252 family protein [Clostridium intestinale]QLY78325.1 RNA-binding protein [Clostridium intestinale]